MKKLIDNSSDIEYVEMTHCWLPIAPNDAIGVEYASAGLSWKGAITNVGIELKPSIPCKLKARRFVRDGIKTSVTGGVI